ncbi:MAG: pentapeptide repeat-containing protein [Myxococcales bacterium]|nr:pentapeptide repeat-containing protein [Myxococcales bacterium]
MQADLSESSRPILFGHQSFREFLVSRCWSELLRVIVDPQTEAVQKTGLIKILRDGQLREGDDRSFDFLRARLRQWPQPDRERLSEWALAEFENDAIEAQPPTLRSDTRRDFRCTALALASTVAPKAGLHLRNNRCLRSLLASYWIEQDNCSLWAVRLLADELKVPGARIPDANLTGANLSRANLSGANFSGANLSGANLSGANLDGADLSGANLSGANLSGATLYGTNLYGTNLYGADLSGANLYWVHLDGATLSGAILEEDTFRMAVSQGAIVDETTRVVKGPIRQ